MTLKHTDLMVDIETLDTRHTAAVLSIGLVAFTMAGCPPWPKIVIRPSLEQQLAIGRTVSAGTLAFWMDQEDESRHRALSTGDESHRETIFQTFNEARLFTALNCVDTDLRVWSKGPSFDMAILDSLFDQSEIEPAKNGLLPPTRPFPFRGYRCVRTIVDLAELGDWRPDFDRELVPHDPVDDCVWQIAEVQEAWRRLGKG